MNIVNITVNIVNITSEYNYTSIKTINTRRYIIYIFNISYCVYFNKTIIINGENFISVSSMSLYYNRTK